VLQAYGDFADMEDANLSDAIAQNTLEPDTVYMFVCIMCN
jgi:hypothetical protein